MTKQSTDKAWINYRPQFVEAVESNLNIKIDQLSIESDNFYSLFQYACRTALLMPCNQNTSKGTIIHVTTIQAANTATKEMLKAFSISHK